MRHLARMFATVSGRTGLASALLSAALLQAPASQAREAASKVTTAAKGAQITHISTASPADLAAGACRLARWGAAVDLMRVVAPRERSAEDWLCLARAQRHTGAWVAALDSYDELAESSGKSARERAARQLGAAEREELEAQLAWIQIVPGAPLPKDAQLALDGAPLPSSRLGVSFPVAPGQHELTLVVDGGVQKFLRLRFEQGERRRVQFALPYEAEPDASSSGAGPLAAAPSARQQWSSSLLKAGGIATAIGFGTMVASPLGRNDQGKTNLFVAGTGTLLLGGLTLITGALLSTGSAPRETVSKRLQLEPWLDGKVAGVSGKF